MSTRKLWDYAINIKEGFVLRKEKVYLLSREKKRSMQVYIGTIKERVHQTFKVTSNSTSVLCRKEEWKETYGIRL